MAASVAAAVVAVVAASAAAAAASAKGRASLTASLFFAATAPLREFLNRECHLSWLKSLPFSPPLGFTTSPLKTTHRRRKKCESENPSRFGKQNNVKDNPFLYQEYASFVNIMHASIRKLCESVDGGLLSLAEWRNNSLYLSFGV